MTPEGGLSRRLVRAFVIQAGLILLAAGLGVAAAFYMLEELLLKQALTQEADYFWEERAADPAFRPPDTRNLTGIFVAAGGYPGVPGTRLPDTPGHHLVDRAGSPALVHVSEGPDGRLYIIYEKSQVRGLAVFFGVLPLAAVLALIYLAAFFSYRIAQRAVSPVVRLAAEVNRLDPQAAEVDLSSSLGAVGADHEVRVLATAIEHYAARLNAFVQREWEFTRDVSHELRTPLTVISMAAGRIANDPGLSNGSRRTLDRVLRSAQDMQELTGAFLLLAREEDAQAVAEPVCLNRVAEEELERARFIASAKPIEFQLEADVDWYVRSSAKVVSVLIGNLVRNAAAYTDSGSITIRIADGIVTVADSGVGIPPEQVAEVFSPFFRGQADGASGSSEGFGVGLTIVKRLADRYRWEVAIDSEPGVGTRVWVRFPDAWRDTRADGSPSDPSRSVDTGCTDG